MPAPNLKQRVRDGELTEREADEITERYWEMRREMDEDRKSEQQEKQNDKTN